MTAQIHDFTAYRAAKDGAFKGWKDSRILSRYQLLSIVEEKGVGSLGDQASPFFKLAFPNGYDPIAHIEDNLGAVHQEAVNRGVL